MTRRLLALILLLALAVPTYAQMALVQQFTPSVGAHWSTGGNAPIDLPVAATAGNLITVEVSFGDGAGTATVSSIDDAGTTSYSCARTQGDSTLGTVMAICWGIAAGASAGIDIVVTWSTTGASGDDMIAVQEWSGNDGTQASLSTNGNNSPNGTSHTSNSVTPGTANNVVIGLSRGGSATWTADAGFTNLFINNRTTLRYLIQSSDTAQSYDITSDINRFCSLAIVAFKGTAGGGGGSSVPVKFHHYRQMKK